MIFMQRGGLVGPVQCCRLKPDWRENPQKPRSLGTVNVIHSELRSCRKILDPSPWNFNQVTSSMYYCTSETRSRVEFYFIPDVRGALLVFDTSSNFPYKQVWCDFWWCPAECWLCRGHSGDLSRYPARVHPQKVPLHPGIQSASQKQLYSTQLPVSASMALAWSWSILRITVVKDFPGGPVVKTPCFHCRGKRVCSLVGEVLQKKKKKRLTVVKQPWSLALSNFKWFMILLIILKDPMYIQ